MSTPLPCTIGLGSNTPDRETRVRDAIAHISTVLISPEVSSLYETPAISGDGTTYTNAVIHGLTNLSSDQLVTFLKDWESLQERTPDAVTIDLDLVIYDGRILRPVDFDRHYFNRGYCELLARGAFQTE